MTIRQSALVGLMAALLAAGCTSTVAGTAIAQRDVGDRSSETALFDRLYGSLPTYFHTPPDEKSTSYVLASSGARSLRIETDNLWLGSPPSLFSRTKSAQPGDNLDTFHPAGSPVDYALLGDRFKDLAPTPWVAYPSFYEDTDFRPDCALPGQRVACKIQLAVDATVTASPDGVVRRATQDSAGGVELTTAVSLQALLDSNVVPVPDDVRGGFTPAMLNTLIPTTIDFTTAQKLQKIEVNGVVPGNATAPDLSVQVGLEIKGVPVVSDFPQAPSGFDVTRVPDKNARATLFDTINSRSSVTAN